MAKNTKNMEHGRQFVLDLMDAARALEADKKAQAESDRAARAVLSTYSPRRQWTTRYGAVFVEGVGFVQMAPVTA